MSLWNMLGSRETLVAKQPTSSPAFLREFTIFEAKSWSSCVKFAISGIEFTKKILARSCFSPYLKQEQKQSSNSLNWFHKKNWKVRKRRRNLSV